MGLGAKVERNGVYTAFYEPMSRYGILYRNYSDVGRQRDMVLHWCSYREMSLGFYRSQ